MKRVSLFKGVILGLMVIATATALSVVSAPTTATPAATVQTARVSQ